MIPNDIDLGGHADPSRFDDPEAAVEHLIVLYDQATGFLQSRFSAFSGGGAARRCRAFYPYIKFEVNSFVRSQSRLSYGFVDQPGIFATTVTRPRLFRDYLVKQLRQLVKSHDTTIEIGVSDTPIPIHFAFPDGIHVERTLTPDRLQSLRDKFDVPDLAIIDDSTANGTWEAEDDQTPMPLALFTGPRIDYSLHRLKHYTATDCADFQNFVIFTNYQFYIDEFIDYSLRLLAAGSTEYEAFVEPGGFTTGRGGATSGTRAGRLPQMPAYHLKRADHSGITIVNIGIGPSNAKTATDHIAVLRPHAWLMLGHCAGLRTTQKLGDYVLAHGYVREDHVLDADLPTTVPIPALAEIQVALEQAVAKSLVGEDNIKSVMRTGTVASIDNRNWELSDHSELVKRFSQSRAVALDMESATIAANGFRFRVPYGTLLCVSDKPLHGELKLPGMANEFYRRQVSQHLQIGLDAMASLRSLGLNKLHSRKLRSFAETAFQ